MSGYPRRYKQEELNYTDVTKNDFKKYVDGQLSFLNDKETLTKIDTFLAPYIDQEKGLPGEQRPATRLKNYINGVLENHKQDNIKLTQSQNFTLSHELLDEFLTKYGFGLSDKEGAVVIAKLMNQMRLISIKAESLSEKAVSIQYHEELNEYTRQEKALDDEIAKLYDDITVKDLELTDLDGQDKEVLTNIDKLNGEIKKNNQDIEEYEKTKEYEASVQRKIDNFPLTKKYNERLEELNNAATYFVRKNDQRNVTQEDIEKFEKEIDEKKWSIEELQNRMDSMKSKVDEFERLSEVISDSPVRKLHQEGETSKGLLSRFNMLKSSYSNLLDVKIKLSLKKLNIRKLTEINKTGNGKTRDLTKLFDQYIAARDAFINNYCGTNEDKEIIVELFANIENSSGDDPLSYLFNTKNEKIFISHLNDISEDINNLETIEKNIEKYNSLQSTSRESIIIFNEITNVLKPSLSELETKLLNMKAAKLKQESDKEQYQIEMARKFNIAPDMRDEEIAKLSGEDFEKLYISAKEKAQKNVDSLETNAELLDLKNQSRIAKEQMSRIDVAQLKSDIKAKEQSIRQLEKSHISIEKVSKARKKLEQEGKNINEKIENLRSDFDKRDYATYDQLEVALSSIQKRMGKLKKTLSDTTEYKNMKGQLERTINELKKQPLDINKVEANLNDLALRKDEYIAAKKKQTRLNPSALRKLRLGVAEDIGTILTEFNAIKYKKGEIEDTVKYVLDHHIVVDPDVRIKNVFDKKKEAELMAPEKAREEIQQNDGLENKMSDTDAKKINVAEEIKDDIDDIIDVDNEPNYVQDYEDDKFTVIPETDDRDPEDYLNEDAVDFEDIQDRREPYIRVLEQLKEEQEQIFPSGNECTITFGEIKYKSLKDNDIAAYIDQNGKTKGITKAQYRDYLYDYVMTCLITKDKDKCKNPEIVFDEKFKGAALSKLSGCIEQSANSLWGVRAYGVPKDSLGFKNDFMTIVAGEARLSENELEDVIINKALKIALPGM